MDSHLTAELIQRLQSGCWLPPLSHPFHSPLHPHRIFQFSSYAECLPSAPPMPPALSHLSTFALAVHSGCPALSTADNFSDVTFSESLPHTHPEQPRQSLLVTSPRFPCLSQNLASPSITLLVCVQIYSPPHTDEGSCSTYILGNWHILSCQYIFAECMNGWIDGGVPLSSVAVRMCCDPGWAITLETASCCTWWVFCSCTTPGTK